MKLKAYIHRHGVGTYIAFAFSILSILLTLILAEVIGVTATAQVKSNIGDDLAEMAFQTADKLDRGMFERYREVQLMARRIDLIGSNDLAEKRKVLNALQETYPYYAWIGMADNRGKVLVSTKGILEGADVSKRPWFQNAYRDIHLGDVHEALLLAKLLPNPTNEPKRFVDVAFPYENQSGNVVGVLGVHLSWHWAREVEESIIDPVSKDRDVHAFIVAKDGTVLLGSPEMQGKTINLNSFKAAQEKKPYSFVTETWPDGKQYLVGFAKSKGYGSYPGLGWTVLVRQSLDVADAPIKQMQHKVLWIGIAIALIFSVIGLFAARAITRPIWALANSAQRIEAGESAEIQSTHNAYFEVKALTKSINSLLSNLKQKESDLRELNLSLEKRVQSRTEELLNALTAVRENEHRIQTIIETAQDAFIGMDLQGNITDWNSQAEKMFGWRHDEIIGRSLAKTLVPERFMESYDKAIQTYYSTGEVEFTKKRLERLVLTRSGEEVPVEMTIGLVESHKGRFFGAFLHDISERKKVERMKNEFISTVSHELRTPLTSIRGSLDLLSAGAVGTFPDTAKNLLDIAKKSSQRLVRLVDDILDIEKIDAGGMQFNMVKQRFEPLVAQAIEATQSYALQFNVKLVLQTEPVDGEVTIDADRIVQVIVNLLSNAVKFSSSGASVQINLVQLPGRVRLSVIDTGEGIPEEFRGRIFGRFAQVDSSDSRKKDGTGLGLSICKSIIEEHGGYIDFQSQYGVGTEFYFELPLENAAVITQQT
jgi:PAS domain S-box-containing protein